MTNDSGQFLAHITEIFIHFCVLSHLIYPLLDFQLLDVKIFVLISFSFLRGTQEGIQSMMIDWLAGLMKGWMSIEMKNVAYIQCSLGAGKDCRAQHDSPRTENEGRET